MVTGRPVTALDVMLMSHRLAAAAQAAIATLIYSGKDSADYQQHLRAYTRRTDALRRLVGALERQSASGCERDPAQGGGAARVHHSAEELGLAGLPDGSTP